MKVQPPVAQNISAASKCVPGTAVKRTDQRTVIRRLHIRYFSAVLPRFVDLIKHSHAITGAGLVEVRQDYPLPSADLADGHQIKIFAQFTLLEIARFPGGKSYYDGLCMPFMVDGELFAVVFTPNNCPVNNKFTNERYMFQTPNGTFRYIEGKIFQAERHIRLNEDFSSGRTCSFIYNHPDFRRSIAQSIGKKGNILSVGTGEGLLEALLLNKGNKITGIENHPESAKAACQKGLAMVQGDANEITKLIDPGSKFDAVLTMEVIGYLWIDEFLENIKQFLRPGGELIVLTQISENMPPGMICPHYIYYDWQTTKALLMGHGFEVGHAIFLRQERDKKGKISVIQSTLEQDAKNSDSVFLRARLTTP